MQNTFWWLIPLAFTILSFMYAHFRCEESSGDYDFFTSFLNAFLYICALVVSLLSWFVYFIIF